MGGSGAEHEGGELETEIQKTQIRRVGRRDYACKA